MNSVLHSVSWISLALAALCALWIALDELRHPQKMGVMNVVWPVTALYLGPFALWAYFSKGRGMAQGSMRRMTHNAGTEHGSQQTSDARQTPGWAQTALAASHCGAGCTLADIVTESIVFATGATLFGLELYASYVWDFVAAWLLGIVFQYLTIKPMRRLSVAGGIWAAVKADTLSILAFQIGMYGWMALVFFRLFPQPHLHPDGPEYWFMMQIAMVCGFSTSLPVNWLLVKAGWKEAMS